MTRKEYICSITSVGATVDFHSHVDLLELFRDDNYNRWVPEITVSETPSNNGYRVNFNNNNDCRVEYGDKSVDINYPWYMMRRGEAILYAGYPLIEQQHQANQLATIHAGCVELNGQGFLFLGESGSGKTTLATKLCQRFRAILFANDLAILGLDNQGLYCSGGTKFFQFRKESVDRSLPNLSNLFPDSSSDSWSQKITIKAKDIGVGVGEGTTQIKHVFKIHVDESKDDLVIASADNISTRLNLNENLTRYIRNTVTIVMGDNNEIIGDVPSMDKPEFFAWRKKAIEIIMKEQNTLYLSGPSDKMIDFIIRQYT